MIAIESRNLRVDEVEIRCLPPGLEVPQSIRFILGEEKDTAPDTPKDGETRRETA